MSLITIAVHAAAHAYAATSTLLLLAATPTDVDEDLVIDLRTVYHPYSSSSEWISHNTVTRTVQVFLDFAVCSTVYAAATAAAVST